MTVGHEHEARREALAAIWPLSPSHNPHGKRRALDPNRALARLDALGFVDVLAPAFRVFDSRVSAVEHARHGSACLGLWDVVAIKVEYLAAHGWVLR